MKEKQSKLSKNIFLSSTDYMIDIFVKKITNYIYEVIHPFPCLKTKESYDRWITRRLWGFRQSISNAKYLRMSVGNNRKL